MMPVRLVTAIEMPVSMNGRLKSTTASRSELIISEVITMSVFLFTNSDIRPFHFPFCTKRKRDSHVISTAIVRRSAEGRAQHRLNVTQWRTDGGINHPPPMNHISVIISSVESKFLFFSHRPPSLLHETIPRAPLTLPRRQYECVQKTRLRTRPSSPREFPTFRPRPGAARTWIPSLRRIFPANRCKIRNNTGNNCRFGVPRRGPGWKSTTLTG